MLILIKITVSAKTAKNKIGIVFNILSNNYLKKTVYKDVTFELEKYGDARRETLKILPKQSLEFVSLDYEKYKNHLPFQLSGGQMRKKWRLQVLLP